MVGGYKIIDFGGIDLNTNQCITGLYDNLESTIGKPVLVRNFTLSGVEVPAFFASVLVAGNIAYLTRVVTLSRVERITVYSDDRVRYSSADLIAQNPSAQPPEEGPSTSM